MKKIKKLFALLMAFCMVTFSFAGCSMVMDGSTGGEGEKGIVDDLLNSLVGSLAEGDGYSDGGSGSIFGGNTSGGGSDIVSTIFSMLMGSESSWASDSSVANTGWGFDSASSYGFGSAGTGSVGTSYADLSDVGSGSGKATVLVYMIGSNLESQGGCGTADIMEMIKADLNDNVNVIIQAGGAKKWKNNIVKADKLGVYKVENGTIVEVSSKPKTSMVNKANLEEFISWGVKNYPADSYSLVFWNHGGGTLAGFGMDELFKGDLSIGDIASAIKNTGAHFKFVGFDACLMGTVETAFALSPYADYLVAAEEEEPGAGWYYTNWLSALAKNPKIGMDKLGTIIVDDFVADNNKYGDNVTLSVMDLSKIPSLYKSLVNLCASCDKELRKGNTNTISNARSKSKAFGGGNYDQIDIIDFCKRCGIEGASQVIDSVNQALVYHKTNMSNTNGIAMYFPYKQKAYYSTMKSMMNSFGMNDGNYTGFFNDFMSVLSGHSLSSRAMNPMEIATGFSDEKEDFSAEDWYDSELVSGLEEGESLELNENGEVVAEWVDDNYAICLSAEDYNNVSYIETVAYLEDGEGYIDLGADDIFQIQEYTDGSADLIISFDNSWIALNGQIVPYYATGSGEMKNGQSFSEGEIYAILTDGESGEQKDIVINVFWNNDTGDVSVLGYRDRVEEGSQAARKLFRFKDGDRIQPLCDYYTLDGNYEDEYLFGDEIVVNGEVTVSYEDLGENPVDVGIHFIDIYDTDYWSELIKFE